ncbi:MAG: hypothetical protein K2Z81_17385 [Cyanobacteria bacterium]|nr:hypothetical protein [Cyanobacteriota bacterium]
MAEAFEQTIPSLQITDSQSPSGQGLSINDIDFGQWKNDTPKSSEDTNNGFGNLIITNDDSDDSEDSEDSENAGDGPASELSEAKGEVKPGETKGSDDSKPGEAKGADDSKPGEARGAMDQNTVNNMIDDLGDDDFETRQKASAALEKVAYDPTVRRSLENAKANNNDPEIKDRARRILNNVDPLFSGKEGADNELLVAAPNGQVFVINPSPGKNKPTGGPNPGRAK